MKSLTLPLIAFIIAVSSVAIAADAANDGTALSNMKQYVYFPVDTAMQPDEQMAAEMSAQRFAEYVETAIHMSDEDSSPSSLELIVLRTQIRTSFEEAYDEIETIEQKGDLAEAALARAIMQISIEQYMEHVSNSIAPLEISTDLSLYSILLTESLIARASSNVY